MENHDPTFTSLLTRIIDRSNGKIHTALPARILSYDSAAQRATVDPVVEGRFEDPDTGDLIPYVMPAVSNVPVLFPGGGGCSITWPLEKGDIVYLVCAERSLDEWLSGGGDDVIPRDSRRFDLTDAVAMPGLRPFSDPLEAVDDDAMVIEAAEIHLTHEPEDYVARADRVEARLQALEGYVAEHEHHLVGPLIPGSPAVSAKTLGGGMNPSLPTGDPLAPSTSDGDTRSDKVKVT